MTYRNVTQYYVLEETIEDLLHQYEINYEPIRSFPVPIEMIAERLFNLRCEITKLGRYGKYVVGLLIPDQRRILIDSECSDSQYNFTLAHELGHWCLHAQDGRTGKFEDTPDLYHLLSKSRAIRNHALKARIEENEANRFAAALLIPRSFLKFFVNKNEVVGCFDVQTLASVFQTSITTMKFRLLDLLPYEHAWLRINRASIEDGQMISNTHEFTSDEKNIQRLF